jgi:hypothetical protein
MRMFAALFLLTSNLWRLFDSEALGGGVTAMQDPPDDGNNIIIPPPR